MLGLKLIHVIKRNPRAQNSLLLSIKLEIYDRTSCFMTTKLFDTHRMNNIYPFDMQYIKNHLHTNIRPDIQTRCQAFSQL